MKNIILKTLFIIALISIILSVLAMEKTLKTPLIVSSICSLFIFIFSSVNHGRWIFK